MSIGVVEDISNDHISFDSDDNKENNNLTESENLQELYSKTTSVEKEDQTKGLTKTEGNVNVDISKDVFLDVLGNNQVLRKIVEPGLGRESRPTHGDQVTVEYDGFLHSGDPKDSSLGALVEEKRTISFVLGDGDVIQALDLCTTLAEKNEVFEFITHPRFAYGDKGLSPNIPPNAFLYYRVKLLVCGDAVVYTKMSDAERLEASNLKRERGNTLYRREDYTMAVNSYSKAIKILEAGSVDRATLSKQNPEHFQQLLTILSNLAAAQIKIEAFSGSLESCEFVLSHQPTNVKAIFRKGKSLLGLGEYAKALACFREALEIEPESAITKQELQRCLRLWQAERDENALLYKRMIGQHQEKVPQSSKRPFWEKVSKFAFPIIGVLIVGTSLLLGLYFTQNDSQIGIVNSVSKSTNDV